MNGTRQARQLEYVRMLGIPSPQPLSQETIGSCMDFVAAYRGEINPLPIDPVALLLAWESYQNKLAEEAAGIEWLENWLSADLQNKLRRAVDDSELIIGCERKEAAESLLLWARGTINRMARGISKW